MSVREKLSPRIYTYLAICAAFFFYLFCFEPFGANIFAFIFAVPIYIAAKFRKISFKKWLLTTAVLIYLVWGVLLIWLRHVYPPAGFAAALLLPAAVAFFVWIWFAILYKLAPDSKENFIVRYSKILALAGLWVFLEWLRSWIFTGFPWLLLAHSQWRMSAIIYSASFGGVWIVSFIIIMFNMGLAEYIFRIYLNVSDRLKAPILSERRVITPRLCPEFYLAFAFVLTSVVAHITEVSKPQPDAKKIRVGMIQPMFEGVLKWDKDLAVENFSVVKNLTASLKNARVDVAILPEAVTPGSFILSASDSPMDDYFASLAHSIKAPILTGSMACFLDTSNDENSYSQNCAFSISEKSGRVKDAYYAKRKLVPFGEYVPFWISFAIQNIMPFKDIKRGETFQPLPIEIAGENYKAGVMICYEDIFPSLGLDVAGAGADFFFVCTNDSWYGREGGAWQHAAHSALQAVSLGRPLLRSSISGLSCVFDSFGRMTQNVTLRNSDKKIYSGANSEKVEDVLDLTNDLGIALNPYTLKTLKPSPMLDDNGSIYFRGAAYADIYISKSATGTFYARHGNWFAYLSMGLMFLPLFFKGSKNS